MVSALSFFILYGRLNQPNDSVISFGEVLKIMPAQGTSDEIGWLIAPLTDSSVYLGWNNKEISMLVNSRPFVDAGLDISELEKNDAIKIDNNMKEMVFTLSEQSAPYSMKETAILQFEENLRYLREYTNYNKETDHYTLEMGNNSIIAWARDMEENKTSKEEQMDDIMFLLDPDPIIEAGADPRNIEGWEYLEMSIILKGVPTKKHMFVKAYNLG